jgi:signal transduction histidine kinase
LSTVTNALLEMSGDGLMALTASGEVLSCNGAAAALFGFGGTQVVGATLAAALARTAFADAPVARVLAECGARGSASFKLPRPGIDGAMDELVVSLQAITSDGEQVILLRGTAQLEEATRRTELEAQNKRIQEANRLKSEFVANMSHELRTPLNSVIGFAELMASGRVGPISAPHKEYLGDILTSSKHLLQLINDVLDLAKIESGKIEIRPEPMAPGKLVIEVRDVLRGLAAERRTKVEVRIDDRLTGVSLDPAKFKQVLYNYLSNAIKFTPEGGRVVVSVTAQGSDQLRIDVEDTGIGIREDDLHRLFIEFQQLDPGTAKTYAGTGLGLAVTKRIVEAQGGTIAVKSALGRGSTFSAVLPRATPASSTAKAHRGD